MTDKELLELAANACNWVLEDDDEGLSWIVWGDNNVPMDGWNPLTDDGDALRLAVKLKMTIHIDGNLTDVQTGMEFSTEAHLDDPYAATRRAIVRAAAEIGKTL